MDLSEKSCLFQTNMLNTDVGNERKMLKNENEVLKEPFGDPNMLFLE